ncbi:MAG: helix-turn-helix transcriptional regulator, partial [Flavobacteriales bacterium]
MALRAKDLHGWQPRPLCTSSPPILVRGSARFRQTAILAIAIHTIEYSNMHFGEKLKELRQRLKLNQGEMAAKLSCDVSTYCRWEHKKVPATHVIERVSKVFDVDAWAWVKPDEPETPNEQNVVPRVVHMKPREDSSYKQSDDPERYRLLNRLLDLFDRWFGRGG